MEVAKINTSFLTPLSSFKNICWYNGPSSYSRSNQLGRSLLFPSLGWHWRPLQVSFSLVSFYAKGFCGGFSSFWVGGGSLLSERWLFPTRYVSKDGVGRLILSKVFLLLCGSDLLGALWVYIADARRWLEHHFCLYIDGFLNGLLLEVQVPSSDIQLGPGRKS